MASRTRSSSRSRPASKAQFFILSAFVIIGIMFVLSQFVRPSEIFDTSKTVLMDEVYIFNNIKEKSVEVVKISGSCNNLRLNIDEYKSFIKDFLVQRNAFLNYSYEIIQPCDNAVHFTSFSMTLNTPRVSMTSHFSSDVNGIRDPICGNDVLESAEQCDDGVSNGVPCVPTYGSSCNYCSTACRTTVVNSPQFCGDGVKNGPEQCDETDGVGAGEICTPLCTLQILADQVVCQDAEDNDLCDGLDILYGVGYRASCQIQYGLC